MSLLETYMFVKHPICARRNLDTKKINTSYEMMSSLRRHHYIAYIDVLCHVV